MKVGRITIITAFLLALPVAAFAGGDPCAGMGGDADGDGVCEDVDNCPGVNNPAQSDPDGDGRGVACDNCLDIQNGPLAYASGLDPVSQCDYDSDGYGNACDGDLNQDTFTTGADNPAYLAALSAFNTPAPGQANLNCDGGKPGITTGADNPFYLTALGNFNVGPSGWSCAGTTTGVCPPLP